MVDLGKVQGFEWDAGNVRKSVDKHSVEPLEAEQIFVHRPLLIFEDAAHSQDEARYHAYGRTGAGRLIHVTFTLRDSGTLIRVVSARDMHRKERERYGQGKA